MITLDQQLRELLGDKYDPTLEYTLTPTSSATQSGLEGRGRKVVGTMDRRGEEFYVCTRTRENS